MSDWSRRLRKVLSERGLSQSRAARLIGASPSVVSGWTSGSRPTDPLRVKRLCDALGVSFCWLMTGEEEGGRSPARPEDMFVSEAVFDGYARVRIEKLIPRK